MNRDEETIRKPHSSLTAVNLKVLEHQNKHSGSKMSAELIFTIFYLLISFGVVYPPEEFISAGFTIGNWFGKLLGSEDETFIRFHIKKSMLNLFVYSCLPIIYVALLYLLGFVDEVSTKEHRSFSKNNMFLKLVHSIQITPIPLNKFYDGLKTNSFGLIKLGLFSRSPAFLSRPARPGKCLLLSV